MEQQQGQQESINIRRIVKRGWKAFLIPAAIIFTLAAAVALLLPAVYKAETTILIEEQQVPEDYVKTTVTSYVEQRLQIITQQIMIRSRLQEIIDRFGLYADMKDRYTSEEIIEKMREDIKLDTISAEVMDKRTGRPATATIAFKLSYEGKDPNKVQQVATVLSSLYLEQNLKTREAQASGTKAFLEEEIERLRKEIGTLEQRIGDFKQAHMGELPEFMEINLRATEDLKRQAEQIDQQIRAAQERKVYLEGQLAGVDPLRPIVTEEGKTVMNPTERLKALRLELLAKLATLSPTHPDVQKMKREIEALESDVGNPDDATERARRLGDLRGRLAKIEGSHGPDHPDVVRLKREIEGIEKAGDNGTLGGGNPGKKQEQRPDNPAYINLRTQIASSDLEIQSLIKEKAAIREKLADYQARMEKTPLVEREYNAIVRDYENARLKYKELTSKLLEAKVAQGLEETQLGERFTIIDPAQLPEKPHKPNRIAILVIGFVLAVGAGVGTVALKEFADHSVKGAEELQALTGLPVLATVPLVASDIENRARKRKALLAVLAGLAVLVALLVIVHLFVMPLDIFWIRLQRRLAKGFSL